MNLLWERGIMMLRKLLTLSFVVGLLIQSELSWSEDYDFRLTKWGMTQKEVISAEEKMDPVERTENLITYKTKIFNKNILLLYVFAQDKLVGAQYNLNDNYLNSEHFIQTYLQFKRVLTKKYGSPSREITKWIDSTFRNNRKKWGLALSLGHTEYVTFWETPNTTIECSLREENFNVLCVLEYRSTEYAYLLEEVGKEDQLDLF